MRILAIDVGTGTQDIMIYDTEKELENSIKLVLPSPHLFISQKIREIENDIYFKGEIMGGGKLKKTIQEHMDKGYDVVMHPTCARTIRDNLEQVKSFGIKISENEKEFKDYTKISLGDINITKLSEFLLGYDLEFGNEYRHYHRWTDGYLHRCRGSADGRRWSWRLQLQF